MGGMTTTPTTDWLDALVDQIQSEQPQGALIVASGHSPSGTYHIGTLREIVTANAIAWALRRAGRDARQVDFVDDFDGFRKVPTSIGVPESWSQYLGQPLRVVPDPFDCHPSYGEHYLAQLHEGLEAIGAMPDESVSGYDAYREGAYVEQIVATLDKLAEVRRILTEVGGRQLDAQWSPVQILSENMSFREWHFKAWNSEARTITWTGKDGSTGEVGIADGRVKLDWRLDWPARWAKYEVSIEPFGRDHATKGGSYDTGKALVRQIFGARPPVPVPYEFINLLGATVKMSKSAGNVLTPQDALGVMPAELLRYFVVKNRPGRTLVFDSGPGLVRLIDEFSAERDSAAAGVAYARAVTRDETISSVPFGHLVQCYQAAGRDSAQTLAILMRTGYEAAVAQERPVIERELRFVANWLEQYAPESVKFSVQEELPEVALSDEQREFLGKLADTLAHEHRLNGQAMHDAIYASAQAAKCAPAAAFVALYRVILGQDAGPKAGWFLAELDHDWLVTRLKAASLR